MATRTYQKHTHHQHILELPDTYIGSTKTNEETRWTYDAVSNKMVWRKALFNPGLYKIFDEIIVNARDEFVRSTITAGMTPVKHIAVTVTTEGGETVITVENDGDGIPIEMNEEHRMMIPQLIFGNLLTSSNYNKEEEKIVGGKHGYGQKCLHPDTNVIMWSGMPKKANEICYGDVLVGDDGTPRTVKDVIRGEGQLFEVQQINAEPYVVNDEHLLTLHMPDHKVILWCASKNAWMMLWWNHEEQRICSTSEPVGPREGFTCAVCHVHIGQNIGRHYRRRHPNEPLPVMERKEGGAEETEDSIAARTRLEAFRDTIPDNNVFDIPIRTYMAMNQTTKMRIAGVRGECVQWPHCEVALDPYVLGLWLGDGMATGYQYACDGEKDPEIIRYLTEWGKHHDATITQKGKYVYQLSSTEHVEKKNHSPLKKLLDKYGLVQNKHIPEAYLFNDRATRLAILAGIIDTDGHVERDGTRITIAQGLNHTRLAHDIVFLARSLGLHCQITRIGTTWTYKGEKHHGEAWNMNISGYGAKDIPTLLPRKKCADPIRRNTSKSTGYLTIVDRGMGPYVGINIDGNQRFIINDFTVTHNCSNIFSSRFQIDLKTPAAGKQYMQTWRDNMYTVDPPTIKKYAGKTGQVKVTFVPDRTRFPGMFDANGIIPEMVDALHTRVIELAALVSKDVKVSWNGAAIASNTFEKYIKLFLRDGMTSFAYEDCGPRWEVGAILASHLYSDEEELPEEKHISFVNGVHTKKGGKHVETVSRKVLGDFCEAAKKKKVDIKPGQLKHSLVLFLNATIVNPSFDSQSKEFLTTPSTEFGSRPEFSGKLVETLVKLGLLEEAKYLLEAKSLRDVKKTDGKKRTVLRGMTKLEDAMLAGTSKSQECTLILTEGDSAATSAISGLKEVGRERWGVFPLRGKLLNVRDITVAKFNANEELTAIKKILGLEQGKRYASAAELRYGRVMVMADQDHDGSHIKGLLMNLFHAEWPTLMQAGFLCTLLTPILKASKGSQCVAFYSLPEFNQWREAMANSSSGAGGWKLKYYKGLGTSTPAEAREWFKNIHEIQYAWDDRTDAAINLAFNKKQADDRKQWLAHYDPTKMITTVGGKTTYTDFVDNELIHFSNADNIRSLPHVMDGLKPSQRKILFCCLKRNLKDEIRVAQLAGYVSEHAAYHHGEASLNGTIVGMAQNFVGSNNVNLLKPVGQFGSALQGGKDAASPRYIHTYLEEITATIFRKEDAGLLTYLEDDGERVEPQYYLPVVPLLAINGSVGIGTGYSTDVPPHRPEEIVRLLRCRLMGDVPTLENHPLDPWWFGFLGTTHRKDESTWITKGLYELDEAKHTVTITALPVGTWTKDYKEFLDALLETDDKRSKEAKKEAKKAETGSTTSSTKGKNEEPVGLKSFDDLYNDVDVRFVLYFTEEGFEAVRGSREGFEKRFKLTTSWKTTNMTCFDTEFNIVKYKTVGDMVEAFVVKRLPMYEARRQMMLDGLAKQMVELDAKRRFIQAILEGRLVLQRQTEEAIVAGLKACEIPALTDPTQPDSYDSYEYVLRMRIDRVKEAAVIELDRQLGEKRGEIAVLEGQTGAGLWLSDLEEFEEAWKVYSKARVDSATSVASSGAPIVKAPRKKAVKKA